MCGIAGFLNPRNNDKKTEKEIYQILKKMNEVQRHRGPDDEGIFLENGCALGHVRLSILDLYRGHQWPSDLPAQGRKRLVSLHTHLPAGAGLFYL